MSDKDCRHDDVQNNGEGWACVRCGESFMPIAAMNEVVATTDAVLDAVTAVFSATLWDLHERAHETHGTPMPDTNPLAVSECEEKGHTYDPGDNRCARCSFTPFFGAS